MVQANVDRILEVLRQKNTATVSELSRKLGLKSEDIEKSAEYLEEDGVIKLEHKFPSTYLHLVNDPGQDVQEGPDFKEENIASEKNPQTQGNTPNMAGFSQPRPSSPPPMTRSPAQDLQKNMNSPGQTTQPGQFSGSINYPGIQKPFPEKKQGDMPPPPPAPKNTEPLPIYPPPNLYNGSSAQTAPPGQNDELTKTSPAENNPLLKTDSPPGQAAPSMPMPPPVNKTSESQQGLENNMPSPPQFQKEGFTGVQNNGPSTLNNISEKKDDTSNINTTAINPQNAQGTVPQANTLGQAAANSGNQIPISQQFQGKSENTSGSDKNIDTQQQPAQDLWASPKQEQPPQIKPFSASQDRGMNSSGMEFDDPLMDDAPDFNLEAPLPVGSPNRPKPMFMEHDTFFNASPNKTAQPEASMLPIQENQEKQFDNFQQQEFPLVQKKDDNYGFPEYAETDIDRIQFLLDTANEKMDNRDYKDLNIIYRKIYNKFQESDSLSPNERHILSNKIDYVFERIKRTYLIEDVVI